MAGGRKSYRLIYNLVSLAGIVLAVMATGLIIAILAVEAFTGVENPYVGIMTYFIFPGMLIVGLLLIPLGMELRRAKLREQEPEEITEFPVIDLNVSSNRRHFIFFILSTFLFLIIVSVATIRGYEFTESATFCGELCHTVMEPEHTAWQNSPHANVRCVECHVGPGAAWYVKAKISGLRQLYAVGLKTYPTPIHTPIVDLRPAADTCGHCHWPQKFYSGRQKVFYHFAPNEQNTQREINMLLKIGVNPRSPEDKGIHGHIDKEIYYVARDSKRQDLPYVMVKEKDGSLVEYNDTESPMPKEKVAQGEKRRMDCIDCHNRPSHVYNSPSKEMDEHLLGGQIDRSLPFIKKVVVDVLSEPYRTKEEGIAAINRSIPEFYAKNYPQLAAAKAAAISQATEKARLIYERNFFPAMKVDWRTYPNNVGHLYSAGCFRCHDGNHRSSSGKVISKDCNLCHQVLGQRQENIPAGVEVKNFVHPVDLGREIYTTNCSECHGVHAKEESHH